MTAESFAPAKINLTLHVTGQRADGYHLLDSLVAFADVGDVVRVVPALDWSLSVTGPMAGGVPTDDSNLVLRAARLTGGGPCAISLVKHLPTASGIGGGSADAAACLRALNRLDGRAMPPDVTSLGADVPVCLRANPCRMSGIGERLSDVPPLPPFFALLVNPGGAVSTPAVFRALRRRDNPAMPAALPAWPDLPALARWLASQRNDLEPAACRLAPEIAQVLLFLHAAPGCLLARMSGSGATCFGLFASEAAAQSAAHPLAAQLPGAWIAPARLGAPTL